MESVWELHGKSNATMTPDDGEGAHDDEHEHDEDEHDDEHGHDGEDYYSETAEDDGQEITVLLIKYASPLAALSLPRDINAESALQAASPAFEITRLLQIVGVGIGWLQAFTGILLASAALSIFAALYSSLKARRYDLAVLRCLGATRWQLFSLLFFEGSFLTVAGIFSGLIFAHGGLELIGQSLGGSQNAPLTGFVWAPSEFALVAGLLIAGLLTAIIPARQAFSTDVAKTLSSN